MRVVFPWLHSEFFFVLMEFFFELSLLVLTFSHTLLLILVVKKVICMFALICFYSKRKKMLSEVVENRCNAGAKKVENTFTCI